IMLIMGEPSRLMEMAPSRIGILLFSAVVGIAMGHTFYYYALEHIGVSICAGVSLMSPFLTAIGSYFIYHEVLTIGQWLSGLLIFSGAMCLLNAQRHLGQRHSPAPINSNTPEIEEIASAELKR
ncbi:DMT family transporter, partial [bacterium]|nr:DMT family transporter [bacterium]